MTAYGCPDLNFDATNIEGYCVNTGGRCFKLTVIDCKFYNMAHLRDNYKNNSLEKEVSD
jgi:hypothetical protein